MNINILKKHDKELLNKRRLLLAFIEYFNIISTVCLPFLLSFSFSFSTLMLVVFTYTVCMIAWWKKWNWEFFFVFLSLGGRKICIWKVWCGFGAFEGVFRNFLEIFNFRRVRSCRLDIQLCKIKGTEFGFSKWNGKKGVFKGHSWGYVISDLKLYISSQNS